MESIKITAELPDWLRTPEDHQYCLSMFESGQSSVQDIYMSRREYTALKEYLVALRGYRRAEELKRIIDQENAGAPDDLSPSDLEAFRRCGIQQIAGRLGAARETFAEFPALVVAPELPSELSAAAERR